MSFVAHFFADGGGVVPFFVWGGFVLVPSGVGCSVGCVAVKDFLVLRGFVGECGEVLVVSLGECLFVDVFNVGLVGVAGLSASFCVASSMELRWV